MELKRLRRKNSGVTLIEVTIAVAIFAAVIGVTAQSLASFYVSIDMQEQRMEAVSTCRGVMDALREKRTEFRNNFPEGLIGWVEDQNEEGWNGFLADNSAHVELDEQAITVDVFNEDGDAASAGDNPVMVQVTTTWKDRKGRDLSSTVISMLTDQ